MERVKRASILSRILMFFVSNTGRLQHFVNSITNFNEEKKNTGNSAILGIKVRSTEGEAF